jgi:hypothetical protein
MPSRRRSAVVVPLALLSLLVAAPLARAEDPAKDPKAAPAGPKLPLPATDAEAQVALATFKEEFRAKGLSGEDRLSQRDFAMERLAKVHHPAVVDALGGVTRNPDPILRTLAVIYLGKQRLHPGLAGGYVVAALKKTDDRVLLMSGLQSIGRLRYLGGRDVIKSALAHQDYAVKKVAIATVGQTGDLRLLADLMRIVGVQLEKSDGNDSGGGQPEQTSEGYSWEGVEVNVDTGTAGDGDQKEAERQGKEQMAANQSAAAAAAGHGGGAGSVGAGGGGEGGGGGGGGSSRSPKELLPGVLGALQQITGEKIRSPGALLKWVGANRPLIAEREKALDAAEKDQRKK